MLTLALVLFVTLEQMVQFDVQIFAAFPDDIPNIFNKDQKTLINLVLVHSKIS